MKNLTKSCIGLNIFIQGLVKQISVDAKVYVGKTVVTERKYHPRFDVVKIVDKKLRNSV